MKKFLTPFVILLALIVVGTHRASAQTATPTNTATNTATATNTPTVTNTPTPKPTRRAAPRYLTAAPPTATPTP